MIFHFTSCAEWQILISDDFGESLNFETWSYYQERVLPQQPLVFVKCQYTTVTIGWFCTQPFYFSGFTAKKLIFPFFSKFEAWECKRFIVIREMRIGLLLQSLCLVPVFSRNTEGSLWHCVLQKPVILQVPVQKKFIAFVVITKPFH